MPHPARYVIPLFALGLITALSGCGEKTGPPAAPTFSSTTPMLPVNTDSNPEINGSAPAGATVKLYTSSDCSGSPASTGTATGSGSFSLGVGVPTGSTTTFHATATNSGGTSACSSNAIAYTYSGPVTGVTCDKVASPTGSDSAAGTMTAPYRTALHLADSLSAGQTGCLRAGDYSDSIDFRTPNVTFTSYPGERATVHGRLFVAPTGNGVTIAGLNLDGMDATQSPTIVSANVTIRDDDITNHHTAICIDLGNARPGFGRATDTVIENNNIHDCGRLTTPRSNEDHGIYLDYTNHVTIRGNWIHGNSDRGMQFYKNGDNSMVTGNVIDSNGEGINFGGTTDENGVYQTGDGNLIQGNAITNSLIRHNVEDAYPPGQPVGSGNVVQGNCVFTTKVGHFGGVPAGSGIQHPQVGFSASGNTVADPQYVNAGAGDYHLRPGSPCASILAGG